MFFNVKLSRSPDHEAESMSTETCGKQSSPELDPSIDSNGEKEEYIDKTKKQQHKNNSEKNFNENPIPQ